LEGDDLLVDVFELSIAVGMTAAFLGLAIDLPAVAKAFEQLGDAARRHLMPHVAQRRGELCMALRYPHQRSHRIADRRRLKQAPQILQHGRIGLYERSAATARAANLWLYWIECFQVLQAAINRAARDTGRPRYGAHAPVSGGASLRCRQQAPFALIKTRTHRLVAVSNRSLINHMAVIDVILKPGNPITPVRPLDSVISLSRLNVSNGLHSLKLLPSAFSHTRPPNGATVPAMSSVLYGT